MCARSSCLCPCPSPPNAAGYADYKNLLAEFLHFASLHAADIILMYLSFNSPAHDLRHLRLRHAIIIAYTYYTRIYISQIVLYELLNSRKARHFDISKESVRSLHMSLGYLAPASYLAKTCRADCWVRHWDTDTRRNLFIDLPRNAVITWLHEPHFRDIIQSWSKGAPTHCMQHVVEERNPLPRNVMLTYAHPHTRTHMSEVRLVEQLMRC